MNLINTVINFFKKIRPRYRLSLDSNFYDLSEKNTVYRFKVFGEHTFPRFTFNDIRNDKNLMYDINPIDLIKITVEDYISTQKKSMIKISEILRDNKYKLSDCNTNEILSGDEICDNILLIEKINSIDLYKIAYNTGFNHGRQLGRELSVKNTDKQFSDNVVSLKVMERKESSE